MSTLLLLLSLALAGEPELPVDQLQALGLDAPTTSTTVPGWRAALPGGGLVKGYQAENEEKAKAYFEAQLKTAQAGVWPQADLPALDADQAVGDGTVSLLLRKGTVVLYVRDLEEDAATWADKVLPLLIDQPSPEAGERAPVNDAP